MFQVCKSGQHSNLSRPTPGPSSQVTQSCLPSIQLEQSQGTPEATGDQCLDQRDTKSVSAKKELNQDQSSPLEQTQMLTETERSKGDVASNEIGQNSLSTKLDRNEEPAKTNVKEEKTSVQIVLKRKQQKQQHHQSSPNITELNQLQDSPETKPAIQRKTSGVFCHQEEKRKFCTQEITGDGSFCFEKI